MREHVIVLTNRIKRLSEQDPVIRKKRERLRLVEEPDSDERRTPAWATLDQLLRSLRCPFVKPPA
jgi:hypothetical protein